MGESAILVTLGTGVSPALNDRVHALARRLWQLGLGGVSDIVPAYTSVLIKFDDSRVREDELEAHISELLDGGAPADVPLPRKHIIPVAYGGEHGPDLERLSATLGLSAAELVRRHSGPAYRVYFLGFMPGFAYLGGLDPSISAPRLPSPRVRVPAGSVGIAGDQTGIYPLASPGGWQLIGRSNVPQWAVERDPPALFAPTDEVLFVPVEALAFGAASVERQQEHPEPGSLPVFAVGEPGALSILQDLGRSGHAHFGLSEGGAMDPDALAAANKLVGNPAHAACLELTWSGPVMTALATTVIAVAGGDLGCRVDGNRVPHGMSWLARAGSEVRFTGKSGADAAARCYLAVAGGFSAELVLGSRSTYLPGGFGGHNGRQLQAGDTLRAHKPARSPAELAGRPGAPQTLSIGAPAVLRYVPFEGPGGVPAQERARAASEEFEVSPASDRMGVRLLPGVDNALARGGGELTSFGVVRGAIQLPPGGTPVVLGADHQTTGGYPLLGVVARADWPVLAQLRPGRKVRLKPLTLAEARAARLSPSTRLAR